MLPCYNGKKSKGGLKMQMIQTGVRIPQAMYMKIKIYCVKNNYTISEFFIGALKNEMKARGIK